MQKDYALAQGSDLRKEVLDIQMHGGICHAITWKWALALMKGQPFYYDEEFFSGVSMQRAYAIQWTEKLMPLESGARYLEFYAAAEPPTRQFIAESATKSGTAFAAQHFGGIASLVKDKIVKMKAGQACLIVCFGTGISDNKNWGHTMGFGIPSQKSPRPMFFNANDGQYSFDNGTGSTEIGAGVLDRLNAEFPARRDNVRDCLGYELSLV
jgi:hypothetical protein